MGELQSYKPYARIVTVVSALIIFIASLDATQVINLFPEYASQINTVLVLCGVLAPAIMQEQRVVRAEELVREDYDSDTESDCESEDVNIYLTLDGQDIISNEDDDTVDDRA